MPRLDGRPSTFAWCDGNDRECAKCRRRYFNHATGKWVLCECPNHHHEENA